jgi:hypothetical protein
MTNSSSPMRTGPRVLRDRQPVGLVPHGEVDVGKDVPVRGHRPVERRRGEPAAGPAQRDRPQVGIGGCDERRVTAAPTSTSQASA